MPTQDHLRDVTASLRSVRARIETGCLKSGAALAASVEALDSLGQRFAALLCELDGPVLTGAMQDLAWAAREVGQLDGAGASEVGHAAEPSPLHRLGSRIDRLIEGIGRMIRSASAVEPLAINARIVAGELVASGTDVADFASEITRSLTLTGATLRQFGNGLTGMRQQISCALADQAEANASRGAAASNIPPRLNETLDALSQRHRRARDAAALASERNKGVRSNVCELISALQIGDSTRQRIEHAESALAMLPDGDADVEALHPEDWHFRRAICSLQAAQLDAAGTQYLRETRIIGEALGRLAREAGGLRMAGRETLGADGPSDAALEAPVSEALVIFANFEAAQTGALRVAVAVTEATRQQSRHLAGLRTMEEDLRILGLNTSLKCGRIGQRGRALSLIAQELRGYANQFAKDAAVLFDHIDAIARDSLGLAAEPASDGSPVAHGGVAEIAAAMKRAMTALKSTGDTVEAICGVLEQDGEHAERLLAETASGVDAHYEIARALSEGAATLATLGSAAEWHGPLPSEAEAMISLIEASYTMAEERAIHARVFHGRRPSAGMLEAEEALVPMAQTLEDMLF